MANPKPANNRLHLDLRTRELGPEVERIRAAGGVVLTGELAVELGVRWRVLADPTATSLVSWSPIVEPEPAAGAGGPLLAGAGGRTEVGVTVRILPLTAAIWHSDKTGQDIKRSLIAYGH